MKLGVFLPSQAKLGLNSKPGLSGVAKVGVGDGKRASFLQILRPKTGLKVKAATASGKPVSSGQGASKTKVSGRALHHALPTEPSKRPGNTTAKLFGEIVTRASQALNKSKKQSKDHSVEAVAIQALQQVVSKATLIFSKKQTGNLLGNSPKTNLSSVAKGQTEKASRKVTAGGLSTVNSKQVAGLKLQKASTPSANGIAVGLEKKGLKNTAKTEPISNKENNPPAGGKIVPKRKTNSLPSSVESKPDTLRVDPATERIQNKRASVIAAIPKAPNRSVGNGARISDRSQKTIPSAPGPANEGRKTFDRMNNRVVPDRERISKTKTTTAVSVPNPITTKKSISSKEVVQGAASTRPRKVHKTVLSSGEQNDPYDKANATKLSKPTRPQRIVGNTQRDKTQNTRLSPELKSSKTAKLQSASLSANSQPKRSGKTEPLGQARSVSLPQVRFEEPEFESKPEATKSFSSKDVLNRGAQNRKTASHLKSTVAQNPQQHQKINPPHPQASPVNGLKVKFDAPEQANNQSSTIIGKSTKGNQHLRLYAETRSLTNSASGERIPNQNRITASDIPYSVKQSGHQLSALEPQEAKGNTLRGTGVQLAGLQTVAAAKITPVLTRITASDIPYSVKQSGHQLSALEPQEAKGNTLRGTGVQLAGLQTVAAAKITPVLTGDKQKNTFTVPPKPGQRSRELGQAASVRKTAKRIIAQAKPNVGGARPKAGGMEDAFLKSDMNLAQKMEQPGSPRQNLPNGGAFASKEVRNHASVAAEMLEAGRSDLSHIRDFTVRNDFANRLNQVEVDLQSLQPKSNQAKGQATARAIVYREVMSAVETFRGMNTSRWAMTIEPFNNLRIQLDLRMSDSQLVVQAKLERGSQAVLGNGWSELQASLAEKDVDLKSLITGNQKEGHSYMFGGKNDRQSDGSNRDEESWFSEELSELVAEFEKEAQKPGKAKRNKKKARMAETTFESWA